MQCYANLTALAWTLIFIYFQDTYELVKQRPLPSIMCYIAVLATCEFIMVIYRQLAQQLTVVR
jgi:hypothetical protein